MALRHPFCSLTRASTSSRCTGFYLPSPFPNGFINSFELAVEPSCTFNIQLSPFESPVRLFDDCRSKLLRPTATGGMSYTDVSLPSPCSVGLFHFRFLELSFVNCHSFISCNGLPYRSQSASWSSVGRFIASHEDRSSVLNI
jgi:hypothetical protein